MEIVFILVVCQLEKAYCSHIQGNPLLDGGAMVSEQSHTFGSKATKVGHDFSPELFQAGLLLPTKRVGVSDRDIDTVVLASRLKQNLLPEN